MPLIQPNHLPMPLMVPNHAQANATHQVLNQERYFRRSQSVGSVDPTSDPGTEDDDRNIRRETENRDEPQIFRPEQVHEDPDTESPEPVAPGRQGPRGQKGDRNFGGNFKFRVVVGVDDSTRFPVRLLVVGQLVHFRFHRDGSCPAVLQALNWRTWVRFPVKTNL